MSSFCIHSNANPSRSEEPYPHSIKNPLTFLHGWKVKMKQTITILKWVVNHPLIVHAKPVDHSKCIPTSFRVQVENTNHANNIPHESQWREDGVVSLHPSSFVSLIFNSVHIRQRKINKQNVCVSHTLHKLVFILVV